MNHPFELLADLLDGTLDEGDLAGVRAHLDSCPACREDVALATAGRDAARSLPQAAAPADLHQRVVAAAGGGKEVPGQGTPAWYRWAGVAAAAAVVVAIAIALPNVGGGDSGGAPERAQGPMSAGSRKPRTLAPAARSRSKTRTTTRRSSSSSPAQPARTLGRDRVGRRADSGRSHRRPCVSQAFDEQPAGRLARLIQARFEGRDAYIAVYLEGPGANEPPDTAVVWVAAKDDCSILSFASARI